MSAEPPGWPPKRRNPIWEADPTAGQKRLSRFAWFWIGVIACSFSYQLAHWLTQ